MALTLDLPEDVAEHLEQEWPDLRRKALEALIVEGYREGLLSHGRVGELLNLAPADTDRLLIRHNAFLTDAGDLDGDLEAVRRASRP